MLFSPSPHLAPPHATASAITVIGLHRATLNIMTHDTLPKQRRWARVPSHSFADVSQSSLANVTLRTVSSLTSIISTPSNNIRRVQQKHLHAGEPTRHAEPTKFRDIKDFGQRGAASRKILNLQQLRKTVDSSIPFVLRKPLNLSQYDYSAFTDVRYQGPAVAGTEIPPPIREAQIKAWELAEKISSNIIFDKEQPGSGDGFGIFEDGLEDTSVDDDMAEEAEISIARGMTGPNCPDDGASNPLLITSIPGYTRGELGVILANFGELQRLLQPVDPLVYEEAERRALWTFREQQSAEQDREFLANHTLSGKRRVQVFHKKKFIQKLFGYSNSVNQEHISNNTSYSSFDNVMNVQKAFHEDKEDILNLIEEERAFEECMAQTAERLRESGDGDMASVRELSEGRLTQCYARGNDDDVREDPQVLSLVVDQLKAIVRRKDD